MSTHAKRAPRPIKPKTAMTAVNVEPTKQTTVEPAMTTHHTTLTALTETVQPATVVDTPPVEETTPVSAATKPATETKRQQTSKAIGVNISSARVRRHLDRLNLNSHIDSVIAELKTPLNQYKTAKEALLSGKIFVSEEREEDGKKVIVQIEHTLSELEISQYKAIVDGLESTAASLEMKITALSRERTRFSNEASVVLSIICDELVYQLTEHTMNRVLAAKKKIIKINHLHDPGVEKLPLYPLIAPLPSFVSMSQMLSAASIAESSAKTLNNALVQAEKDFRKKYNVHMSKKKKTPETVEPAADAVENSVEAGVPPPAETHEQPEDVDNSDPEHDTESEDDSAEGDSKTSFKFYVDQVCKVLRKDPKYKAVRVSTEIRKYLSDLLIEFIKRVSTLVLLTAMCMKNKTINDVAILRTIESLLIDGHAPHETLEFKDALVHDPVALKAETDKRDEEKKAGREYRVDMSTIPKIPGLVAVRTITYPTSGYHSLYTKVQEKMKLHEEMVKKNKDTLAESDVDSVLGL